MESNANVVTLPRNRPSFEIIYAGQNGYALVDACLPSELAARCLALCGPRLEVLHEGDEESGRALIEGRIPRRLVAPLVRLVQRYRDA
jgi:hypothetical protein